MSVTYGNANYRKKFDAFRIIDQSGHEPLKEAIACALRLRENVEKMLADAVVINEPSERLKALSTVSSALMDTYSAWKQVAEFVYAKPRHITVDGNLTLNTERLAEDIRDARLRILNPGA